MSLEIQQQPKSPEARGAELLAQWKNLVHEISTAGSTEARIRGFEALSAWELAREGSDWDLIDEAQRVAGKAGLRALAELLEDLSPIGQRR